MNIMKKLIRKKSVIVCLSMLLFCMGCNQSHISPKLNINQHEITADTLQIQYQVQNNSPDIVWFCEDVSIYLPFDEICDIKETTAFVNRKVSAFPGPDFVSFDEPMIGKYVSIQPGQTMDFSVNISLFDRFESFSEYTNRPSFSGVNNIVLSVGYFDAALCKKYMKLKHTTDKQSRLNRELSQFVNENHDTDIPECLYVPHFWEGIKKEKILDYTFPANIKDN